MNMDDLSYVEFGDVDGLGTMLFENGVQHKLFYEQLADKGILIPQYPIIEVIFYLPICVDQLKRIV